MVTKTKGQPGGQYPGRKLKMKEHKTNVEVVTNIMEFSRYGALAQAFVIDALVKFSDAVSKCDPKELDSPLLNGAAWVGVAQEISAKLKTHLGK